MKRKKLKKVQIFPSNPDQKRLWEGPDQKENLVKRRYGEIMVLCA